MILTWLNFGGIKLIFFPILFSKLCVCLDVNFIFETKFWNKNISGMRGRIDDMDVRWTFKTMVVGFGWVGGCSELAGVLALTEQYKLKLLVLGRRVCNLRSIIVKFIWQMDILGGIIGEIVAGGSYDH